MMLSVFYHLMLVLLLSPLLLGIVGKTKACFAGRWGPPLLQTWHDIFKLFGKGAVYSPTTSWVFRLTPVIVFAGALVSCLLVPLGDTTAPLHFWGDVIFWVYLYALMRFFLIIGALDTGSSFEGMGASREAVFSCLAEIVLFMDLILLAAISRSLVLSRMLSRDALGSWQSVGPVLLLVIASYFLVLLVENSRIPVDDPATHLELTMIHEVMVLDHSGWDLGYILYGSAVKLFVMGSLLVTLFIPPHLPAAAHLMFFLAGMAAIGVLLGVVESTMARLRLSRVPQLLIGAFVLALLGFVVLVLKGS